MGCADFKGVSLAVCGAVIAATAQWQRLEVSLVGSGRAGRSCQRLIDKESRLRNSCSDLGTVGVESDEVDSPRLTHKQLVDSARSR